MSGLKMRLVEHIAELRRRIFWCALFFAAAFVIGWQSAPDALDALTAPLAEAWSGGVLMYNSLTAPLMIRLNLSLMIALALSMPFFVFQTFRFARPALKKGEAGIMLGVMLASPAFFVLGAAFVYFALMPLMFQFFVSFADEGSFASILLPDMSGYIALCVSLMKTFGLAFQFPIILVVLNRLGVLSRSWAVKSRRYVWVGMFVLASVLTPPDVVSAVALAFPLIFLFEGSLLFMKNEKPILGDNQKGPRKSV
ncbi:MAG: twin-arginine translocase subunit TatC [Alphaproteobacteria bacterium]|nr:twin-arginine translocase subunit TatC [Alphaproteobacteria bacterium]